MKFSTALSASILAASGSYAQQSGPAANAISYDFSPFDGVLNYKTVTKYDWSMGGCAMQPATANSPIAPLDQGLTAVFRGPLQLKQFAVYNLGSAGSSKREAKASPRAKRHHAHERFHRRMAEESEEELEKRGCGDMITATIDGKQVSFPDTWNCGAGGAAAPANPAPAANSPAPAANSPAAKVDVAVPAYSAPAAASSAAPAAASSAPASGSSSSSSGSSSSGAWNRVAFYSSSSPSSSQNVTFTYPVPYANTDFLPSNGDTTGKPAGSSQMLNDITLGDGQRFYLSSATPMSPSPAAANKAYHGFSGSKIMLVEMGMPMASGGAAAAGASHDMPAFWLLNEQLPATNEHAQCNCWASGCGEWDIHEVLAPGAKIGYSTLHMGQQYCGGASNGFARATTGTQKLAVIIKAGKSAADSVVRVVQLDDSYSFGSSISQKDYDSWVAMPIAGGQKGSLQIGKACPDPASIAYKK